MFFTCWLMHENLFMIHLSVYGAVGDRKACGSEINMKNIFSNTSVDQKRPLPVFQVYVAFDKICDQ